MQDNMMTGPIFLSDEDSKLIRQKLSDPGEEYIETMDRYFNKLANSMNIQVDGVNTSVEFDDLDLSNLDAILDNEVRSISAKTLEQMPDYNSVTDTVLFVKGCLEDLNFKNAAFVDAIGDALDMGYSCDKNGEKVDIQEYNLIDAA